MKFHSQEYLKGMGLFPKKNKRFKLYIRQIQSLDLTEEGQAPQIAGYENQ